MKERSLGLRLPLLWIVWLAVAVSSLAFGLEYYATPLAERGFSTLHDRWSPAGQVGHGFGIVGTALVLGGVLMYSARKRLPRLARVGRLKHWLEVHIFLCTLGPYLVLLHTTFKFGGIVSIAFWSMVAVVASGVVGRYLYVRIPKTIHGHFLSLNELEQRRQELATQLAEAVNLSPEVLARVLPRVAAERPRNAGRALLQAVRADLGRRAGRASTRRALAANGVPSSLRKRATQLADEQARLQQTVLLLEPFQRLFRYWHVFHLPLAILMLVIAAVHVAVAIAFGYGWPY